METLGTSHPSFWILEQQQQQQQREFSAVHIASGGATKVVTTPLEVVSLGRSNGECVSAELQQACSEFGVACPPMAASTPECRPRDGGEDHGHLPPARKLQKAGRERLRRDQLNEQFAKLADVLDPIRPRNDKGSILAESILAVNELRAEIARMKTEHIALSDESRDLSAEKSELQEEKTHLETETSRLQEQLKPTKENTTPQSAPAYHPSLSLAQFPYNLMMKGALPSKEAILAQDAADPMPFFPVSPFMHPAYHQTYGMLGSRQPPFGHFAHSGQQIHVERPSARYPVPIHPTAIYPSKVGKGLEAMEAPVVVATDLQLGLTTLKPQLSGPDPEPTAPAAATGRALSEEEDAGSKGVAAAAADAQLPSELSLSSNSTVL